MSEASSADMYKVSVVKYIDELRNNGLEVFQRSEHERIYAERTLGKISIPDLYRFRTSYWLLPLGLP